MKFFKSILQFTGLFTIMLYTSMVMNAQSESGRVAVGFNAGLNKYWGSFTDNQIWFGGDAFVRVNILNWLSVHGSYGIGQLRYTNTSSQIAKYPGYYAKFNGNVPAKSFVRLLQYEGLLSVNLFPSESLVPYVFGGVGYLDFNPVREDGNIALPNNSLSVYKKTVITTPFGAGLEFYLNDNLVFNMKAAYYLGVSEWLDDLDTLKKDDGTFSTVKDDYATFGVGFSYYILGNADLDGDRLTNSREKNIGTDPMNPDTDGDGLTDGAEVLQYHSDPLKQDTDGDGVVDGDEVNKYGTDPTRTDSDSDGLTDGEEVSRKTDPKNSDSDADALLDGDEVTRYKTDPLNVDTDKDGLNDGDEANTYQTNPIKSDTDGDGLTDGDEILKYKTNPVNTDTDGDGLNDGLEIQQYKSNPVKIDTDGDGLNDGDEVNKYLTDPSKKDTDGDNLNDGDEVKKYSTSPNKVDTDSDKLNDGIEVNQYTTDPTKSDTDTDGLTDGDEVNLYKTNPLKKDTDGDGLTDGDEVLGKHPLAPGEKTNPNSADTDGDSIADNIDYCPNIIGLATAAKKGCPDAPKIGTKVDFPEILFIVNTDEFNYENPSTSASLAKLLSYVNQCTKLIVSLEGHASAEGPAKRNQELSNLRAKKVRTWLIEQGVSSNKIQGTIGYGSSRPKIAEPKGKISKEELEVIRKQNRRITVVVVHTCDA